MPRHTRHERGWDADERETRVEIAFLHRNASLLWVRLSQAGLVFPFSHCVRFRALEDARFARCGTLGVWSFSFSPPLGFKAPTEVR
jgi:hypothetical protein